LQNDPKTETNEKRDNAREEEREKNALDAFALMPSKTRSRV
jgi:hypothetical protein